MGAWKDPGIKYYSHHVIKNKPLASSYDRLHLKHWHVTHDPNQHVDIFLEGRWVNRTKDADDLTIGRRFTMYDGFVLPKVGKFDNQQALRAVLDYHPKCNFRYLKQFDISNKTERHMFCEYRKTDPSEMWLRK